jgi:6-phosphogluconolactonase
MLAGTSVRGLARAAADSDSSKTMLVYFGTYTGAQSQGIYVARFEPATGTLGSAELAAETRNPTFLALGPQRRTLYAVNEIDDFGHGKSGAVSAFTLDPETGHLKLLNQEPSGGTGPCHLAVATSSKCVLVANYVSGSVAVLPLDSDGQLSKPSASIQHRGSSVNRQRQEGPHAHFITWDPDNRIVLACDLGLDKVLLYQLDPSQQLLSAYEPPSVSIDPGSGPRHLSFHPAGHFVYVLNELSSTVTCCSYQRGNGELKPFQTISTLPPDYHKPNTCAEIAVHPSGRFLYASNRGHDSIAVFGIDGATGKVTLLQHESTQGKTPRHFALDPSARWLLAENQDSDNVVVFSVDPQNGRLSPTGTSQKIGTPVCAVFVPKN